MSSPQLVGGGDRRGPGPDRRCRRGAGSRAASTRAGPWCWTREPVTTVVAGGASWRELRTLAAALPALGRRSARVGRRRGAAAVAGHGLRRASRGRRPASPGRSRRAPRRAPTGPATPRGSRRRSRAGAPRRRAPRGPARTSVGRRSSPRARRPPYGCTTTETSPSASRARSGSPGATSAGPAYDGAVGALQHGVPALQRRGRRQRGDPGPGVREVVAGPVQGGA